MTELGDTGAFKFFVSSDPYKLKFIHVSIVGASLERGYNSTPWKCLNRSMYLRL